MAGFFSSPPVCGAGGRVYYPGASGGVLRGGHAEASPPDHEQHSLPELRVVERGSGIATQQGVPLVFRRQAEEGEKEK